MKESLGIIILFLLISIAFFVYIDTAISEVKERVNYISTKFSDLDSRISYIEQEISEMNKSLSYFRSNISDIRKNLSSIQTKLSSLEKDINLLKEQFEEIKNISNDILSTEDYIKNWFESSIREVSPTIDNLIYNAYQCIKGSTFDLGCFSYYLYSVYGLKYVYDNITYGKEDVLIKPSTFLRYKKGDCEDFALLYFIILNKVKDRGYYLKIPKFNPGSRYYLYETPYYIYYLDNYGSITENLNYYNVYFVCFDERDLYDTESTGHCVVALCKNLGSFQEIFSKCLLLEPQTYGSLYIRNDISDVYSYNGIEWYIIENISYLMNKTHFCYFSEISRCIEI